MEKKVKADVLVAESLKRYIVEHKLEAGDKLPTETELCDSLGVARHTLREGIKRLSQLGILESITGSGTYVMASSYDRIEEYFAFLKDRKEISKKEIYDVRVALESTAARITAFNATDADIRKLEIILNRMNRSVENSDYEKFVEYNMEFHNAVVTISQNRLLIGITHAIQNLIRYSMSGSETDFERNIIASYDGHVQIFEAIRDHDGDSAQARMIMHLEKNAASKM